MPTRQPSQPSPGPFCPGPLSRCSARARAPTSTAPTSNGREHGRVEGPSAAGGPGLRLRFRLWIWPPSGSTPALFKLEPSKCTDYLRYRCRWTDCSSVPSAHRGGLHPEAQPEQPGLLSLAWALPARWRIQLPLRFSLLDAPRRDRSRAEQSRAESQAGQLPGYKSVAVSTARSPSSWSASDASVAMLRHSCEAEAEAGIAVAGTTRAIPMVWINHLSALTECSTGRAVIAHLSQA